MLCGDLARLLAVDESEVVRKLFKKGVMAQANKQLDVETVRIAAAAFGSEAIEVDEVKARTPPNEGGVLFNVPLRQPCTLQLLAMCLCCAVVRRACVRGVRAHA